MKKKCMIVFLCIVFCCTVFSCSPKNEWKPLFGMDYSEAIYDQTAWYHHDGVLTATEDREIWAVGEYENFELKLEFMNEPGTNSGVIVYCTDIDNWIPNSVEIQIADDHSERWGTARKDFQCGAIFGHLAASRQKVVKEPGEWNTMHITCKGQQIDVVLNGEKIVTMDMSLWTSAEVNPDGSPIPQWLSVPKAQMATRGAIGFQGKHGDASIHFRNVMIRML